MEHQPRVSVITIFWNAAQFLQEAIGSVFAQTCDDWELVLVDDGSTDGSAAIALRYAERYPGKVRYFEHAGHENHGASASRNLGISHARGEYIALLDAEDVWLPHKLQQQVAILDSQPEAGMVYGASQYWYSWTGNPAALQNDCVPPLGVPPNTLVRPPTLLTLSYPLGKGHAPCPSDLLFRRQMVERIGGFEETFHGVYQLYEDQVFLVKVYLRTAVFVASACWNLYRQHPDSCVSAVTRAGQYHTVRLFFLNWLAEYLAKQGGDDAEVWKALQTAFWPYRHPRLYGLLSGPQWLVKRRKELPLKALVWTIARRTLPGPVRRRLWKLWQLYHRPPVGDVHFGSLRRVTPISHEFGFDRGQPIDRYYLENFLARHANDIRGRVLEVGDDAYTRQFGGNRVTSRDVLHVVGGNPQATFVGDLTCADHLPSDAFDCVILTQTLHLIYDVRAALKTLYRIMKPAGILLATAPGISQISEDQWGAYWCWSFTSLSVRRLFTEVFPAASVDIQAYGNVLAAAAFLYGLAAQELHKNELDHNDPSYEVLITVRAVKPEVTR
jgi:glycosyltransferase involved in cell wall biosynthesis